MSGVARFGVNPDWLRNRNAKFLQYAEILNVHNDANIASLEYYAENGETKQKKFPTAVQEVQNKRKWEDFVDSLLGKYGLYRLWNFEQTSIEKNTFDIALANSSFSATYLSQMIRLFIHFKFPARFNGRKLQMLLMDGIAYTALGILIGRNDQAFSLARLQLLAYRQGFYSKADFYPIFHFMMRILADYLGELPHIQRGESVHEPVFNALYSLWRAPDAEAIVPTCLAALDLHTYCSTYCEGEIHEFDAAWHITPIELLLMFKLRELQGLANPKIDHPLMNSPLGVLPHMTTCGSDTLMDSMRDRMQKDGFNENEIFVECYGSKKN
ncbi:hypothetical protein [Solimicrobium silvestre]|uniref:Uncharacterized protein n=1 Tax=Solimicrobium silvestre TaxID=2099400 RepID=A0A2S9H1R2_9BURK|nr:hypothetical protein [Solimicrobium silvestre]PRC93890.1 hypothetical protein S2091_1499 [Solimicrobium silvestre]